MKVRIGYALGARAPTDAAAFAAVVDALEDLGYDSLWLSERATGPAPDPVVGLAVAAGRTRRIKLGTSVQVLPGRNPVLLAKAWATLDLLSGGRALPAFGLGIAEPAEQQAFGVARAERAPWFDEVLPLLRRCWSADTIDHDGPRFTYRGLRVLPKPVQQPFDVWLGGRAPAELRRVGRLGDGWLASFQTPEQVAGGRAAVETAAAEAGRSTDDEHWGAMVVYVPTADAIPPGLAEVVARRNPDVAIEDLVAVGPDATRAACEAFVDVGFSKLVLVPFAGVDDWDAELATLAEAVLDLQT